MVKIPSYFIPVKYNKLTPMTLELWTDDIEPMLVGYFQDKNYIVTLVHGVKMYIFNIDGNNYMIEKNIISEMKIDINKIKDDV